MQKYLEEFFYVGLRTLICPVCHWERSKVDWYDASMQTVVRGEQIVQQWQKAHVPAALGSHSRLNFSFAFETMRNGSHFSLEIESAVKCALQCLLKHHQCLGENRWMGVDVRWIGGRIDLLKNITN